MNRLNLYYDAAERHYRSVLAAIKEAAAERASRKQVQALPGSTPFITISRQAGAGGKLLPQQLVETLNRHDPQGKPWSAWDQELIERVAFEHNIPPESIAALEDDRRPWFLEFVNGLISQHAGAGDESIVYARVAETVRALALAGRAVIVGRGGVYLTAGMDGGVHVRLVAPLAHRVENLATQLNISLDEAVKRVAQIDHNRAIFYKRYWPKKQLTPDIFIVTLNTAALTDDQMIKCLLPLVHGASTKTCKDGCQCKAKASAPATVAT